MYPHRRERQQFSSILRDEIGCLDLPSVAIPYVCLQLPRLLPLCLPAGGTLDTAGGTLDTAGGAASRGSDPGSHRERHAGSWPEWGEGQGGRGRAPMLRVVPVCASDWLAELN